MFSKILIANRGEIAVRVIRACRELGVQVVVAHSEADRESLAVRMADEAVCVGPAASDRSYRNVPAVIQAIPEFVKPIAGAFLVAVPDVANPKLRPKHLLTFGPYPRNPLPFPSITIASRNDPYCPFEVAEDIASAWGSLFIDAGEAGHLNSDSGFGPWPEGSMTFAKFLTDLKP